MRKNDSSISCNAILYKYKRRVAIRKYFPFADNEILSKWNARVSASKHGWQPV